MIDQYTNLRTAYYSLLQGSITLGGNTVNVYDMVQANEDTPYIYFGEFEAVEDSTKGDFTQRVTIGISVITKYTNAVGGSADSDNIVNQILKLLHNDTYLSGSTYRVLLNKVLANFTTKQPTSTGTRIVKTIRLEHVVEQIGGDLTRITDLTATRVSNTQIDLAWSNVTGNTGYRIERSTDAATWSLVTTVAQDSVSYSNTGLTNDITYSYRVRAFDSSGGSGWSNIASATAYSDTGITPSGILYAHPQITGQTTSYRTGDDAWQVVNNPYNSNPSNPATIAELSDFTTLTENNAFGNTDRFTDDLGTQVYTNNYVVDHYTGLGWYLIRQYDSGSNGQWNESLDGAIAATFLSFNNWKLPNIQESNSIADISIVLSNNYSPFSLMAGTFGDTYWASNTNETDTSRAYVYQFSTNATQSYNIARQQKTTQGNYYILCRNHY